MKNQWNEKLIALARDLREKKIICADLRKKRYPQPTLMTKEEIEANQLLDQASDTLMDHIFDGDINE